MKCALMLKQFHVSSSREIRCLRRVKRLPFLSRAWQIGEQASSLMFRKVPKACANSPPG